MSDDPTEVDEDDWGCEHCRNDGALNEMGCCPECDAQYFDDGEQEDTQP